MNPVFPSEIIKQSVESHFSRFNTKTNLLYIVVVTFFIGAVISLFLIKTEISVQSRGIIRSSAESVPVNSPVVAEIIKSSVNENMHVQKGDTLLQLKCGKLDKQILLLKNLIAVPFL